MPFLLKPHTPDCITSMRFIYEEDNFVTVFFVRRRHDPGKKGEPHAPRRSLIRRQRDADITDWRCGLPTPVQIGLLPFISEQRDVYDGSRF